MDAVRATIRELGGEVVMTSEKGVGTCSQIRLPLTLAIMAALIVEADDRPFAIPLDRIERTVRLVRPRRPLGRRPRACWCCPTACCRSSTPPSASAARRRRRPTTRSSCAAATSASRSSVTKLIGQHELVTRPLPPEVGDGSALSGAAVLSDGQIALIVDCDAIADVLLPA